MLFFLQNAPFEINNIIYTLVASTLLTKTNTSPMGQPIVFFLCTELIPLSHFSHSKPIKKLRLLISTIM